MRNAALCAVALLTSLPCFAGISPLVTVNGGDYRDHSGDIGSVFQSVGWEFTPTTNLNVTSLDWYSPTLVSDQGPRTVAIWQVTSSALVTAACVGPGCGSGAYHGSSYWFTPDSATLTKGTEYVIGAAVTAGDSIVDSASITVNPLITYGTNTYGDYTNMNDLNSPGAPLNTWPPQYPGYFGPNLTATAATPEPALYGMISIGLGGLLVAVRRRRNK